ncbi:hypothetical protein ZWY2020_010784 [Hordeum vulgare]|nr:hypothetical protein ZWY2020_010784 [Hordeum vulgare]
MAPSSTSLPSVAVLILLILLSGVKASLATAPVSDAPELHPGGGGDGLYREILGDEMVFRLNQLGKIPLDMIWNDDDHMDARKDFTLSTVNNPRPKLVAFLDKIHKRGMKYIVVARHVHQQSPARAPARDAGTSHGAYKMGAAAG